VANRPSIGLPKLSKRGRILLVIAVAVVVLLLAGARLVGTYVDLLWYGEVGFRSVFTTELITKIALFFGVGILVGGLLAVSLVVAYRTRPVFVPVTGTDDPLAKYRSTIVQRVRLFGFGVPILVGIAAGSAAHGEWQRLQLLLNATAFGIQDEEFHNDIGFYAFKLPFYTWLIGWVFTAIVVSFFGALIMHYLFGGIRLAGRGGQLSVPARVHLSVIAGVFVLVYALDYYFDRYELLFSSRNPLFTGATYTDLNAVLPAKLILMFIAGFCAVAFFAGAFMRNLQLPAIALALLVLSGLLVGTAWPAILEQFSVKPNANEKESVSIERNVRATRQAYGLTDDKVTVSEYEGKSSAPASEIRNDQGTIPNARLLDPSILSPTFTQRVGQQNFYGFPDKLDVDRYKVDGKVQDYVVAAREVRTAGLAENQRSWINQHLVYTHGNGFVAAPANKVDRALQDGDSGQGGYPIFTVSDLNTINDPAAKAQMDIPLDQPRIYYGELATGYVIVGGTPGEAPGEYDTPSSRFYYNGAGGVPVNGWFNRLVFAAHYGERNILFSGAIGDGSKIMYNRDPKERVSKAAPWLTVDGDPYPAVVDGRIKWIIDGYTTLENYPYAQRTSLGTVTTDSLTTGAARQPDRMISYIRNSVKATVDAYDGTVTLYEIDSNDPVLKAWQGVFPGTVKPASEVPQSLREHFRYPEDLFKVQRDLLAKYHVGNAQEFYSTETFWDVPPDPTQEGGPDVGAGGAKQPPYYVLAQAPGQDQPTFQVTSALNLLRRQFLGAWVSVSSDPLDYGKIRVLRLKSDRTEGPVQVQNRFQTTPEVTENRTLFNNPSVDVEYGNLLTLPVAGGLLYVEPIYIKRKDQNAFPQLARVLVYFGDKVGFAPTIDEALNEVFGPGSGDAATKPGETPPPDQGPTTPPAIGGQVLTPEMAQAMAEAQAAFEKLKAARSSGSFTDQGKALDELDAAMRKYEQARAAAATQQTQPPQPGAGG
jgi:uncharacterized membrane protein (UPF0182 family)